MMMMATKKSGGSASQTKDSAGRRLGIKLSNGQTIKCGMIIVRQRGFKYHPGTNVFAGKDHTLHAHIDGVVRFFKKRVQSKERTFVSVDRLC